MSSSLLPYQELVKRIIAILPFPPSSYIMGRPFPAEVLSLLLPPLREGEGRPHPALFLPPFALRGRLDYKYRFTSFLFFRQEKQSCLLSSLSIPRAGKDGFFTDSSLPPSLTLS